jgi:hypothetical protein
MASFKFDTRGLVDPALRAYEGLGKSFQNLGRTFGRRREARTGREHDLTLQGIDITAEKEIAGNRLAFDKAKWGDERGLREADTTAQGKYYDYMTKKLDTELWLAKENLRLRQESLDSETGAVFEGISEAYYRALSSAADQMGWPNDPQYGYQPTWSEKPDELAEQAERYLGAFRSFANDELMAVFPDETKRQQKIEEWIQRISIPEPGVEAPSPTDKDLPTGAFPGSDLGDSLSRSLDLATTGLGTVVGYMEKDRLGGDAPSGVRGEEVPVWNLIDRLLDLDLSREEKRKLRGRLGGSATGLYGGYQKQLTKVVGLDKEGVTGNLPEILEYVNELARKYGLSQ